MAHEGKEAGTTGWVMQAAERIRVIRRAGK